MTYGLGCEADNLPALVVMTDPDGKVKGGTPLWGNGFLPAIYQGATLQTAGHARSSTSTGPTGSTEAAQRRDAGPRPAAESAAPRAHRPPRRGELDARIAAYELAFRMQAAAPEAVDVRRETDATRRRSTAWTTT